MVRWWQAEGAEDCRFRGDISGLREGCEGRVFVDRVDRSYLVGEGGVHVSVELGIVPRKTLQMLGIQESLVEQWRITVEDVSVQVFWMVNCIGLGCTTRSWWNSRVPFEASDRE